MLVSLYVNHIHFRVKFVPSMIQGPLLYALLKSGAMGSISPENPSVFEFMVFSALIAAIDPVAVMNMD